MTEPTPPSETSEPETGPVLTHPTTPASPDVAPQTVYVQESSRLNKVAAWFGIAAGSVFIVAVIFGTGFLLGAHAGGDGPRGHDRGNHMMMRHGAPMSPMGPRGEFERGPGFPGPFGPGGPMIEAPRSPGGPGGSDTTTTAPPRP